MSNVLQSAYKQFYSTETALLKVHNDVTLNMDKGKVTALTLLDLSAAFDTIDHNIPIKCLSIWHSISGTALSWFPSYLTDRYQRMKIANCFSAALPTSCGVPQGSVLGPLLFLLFTLLQLFKLTTWTTTYMQMIHRFTFPWLPWIQIAS